MSRGSGNCQTGSSQGTHAACPTTWHQGYIELISDRRPCHLAIDVGCRPIPHECCVACYPSVQCVPFLVSDYTEWRDRTDPARGPLPRSDRVRVIHADRLVLLDDLSAAVGGLPFERA